MTQTASRTGVSPIRARLRRAREAAAAGRPVHPPAEQRERQRRIRFERQIRFNGQGVDHYGVGPAQYPAMRELVARVDDLHAVVEQNGRTHKRDWYQKQQRRLTTLIRRLAPDTDLDTAQAVAAVLTDQQGREQAQMQTVIYLDSPAAVEALATRTVPGPEETVGVVETPPTYTDDVVEDSYRDRARNFVATDLFAHQERSLLDGRLAAPLTSIAAFTEWLAARALIYGINRVRSYTPVTTVQEQWVDASGRSHIRNRPVWGAPVTFTALLAETYPDLQLDVDALARYARPAEDGGTTPLSETRPARLVADLYAAVPGAMDAVGRMVESYCDLVRASRPKGDDVDDPDLPNLPRPRAAKDGWHFYRYRIAHVYRVTNNAQETARAFGVRKEAMLAYLAGVGLAAPYARGRRQRRRY